MTRAVVFTKFGGPDVLEVAQVADVSPNEGEVAISVEAAGVNPIDWKVRSGSRATGPLREPQRVGADGAGVVTAVGVGVDGFRVGDPVAFREATGAYASDLCVPASKVFIRPSSVDAPVAAALGIPVGTAYQSLRSLGVTDRDVLLIHGGSGSVGQAAIQLALLWGARVIATTSQSRVDRVRHLGAEPVVYGEGLADRLRACGADVTAVLDAAGTDEGIAASLDVASDRTRIATIVRGKEAATWGIRAFLAGSGVALTAQQEAWRSEAMPVVLSLVASGRFQVEIGARYTLDQAADAHHASESGAPGKLVIEP